MKYLNFIKTGKRVYHITKGWGEVTAGEPGKEFQVQFPNIKEIQSFKADGSELDGVNRSIYEDEVNIVEKKLSDITLYGLRATILENGSVDLDLKGVNNSEILQIIEALMEVVVKKELSKDNTIEVLNNLINALAINMKQTLANQAG